MIKCKQAMESSACGKVCCCLECEERESCKDVCTELSPDCEDAFSEETALATMQTEAAAIIKGIAATTRTTIDSTKLKKDLPDVAAKYSKTSNVSASVKITVK